MKHKNIEDVYRLAEGDECLHDAANILRLMECYCQDFRLNRGTENLPEILNCELESLLRTAHRNIHVGMVLKKSECKPNLKAV